jgi:GH24 family phage-related lysozyme (muramidase)
VGSSAVSYLFTTGLPTSTTNDALINMLKRHEGVRDKVYMCSAGYETIGVGRNISESGLGLSNDEIEYLLRTTLSDAETSYWVSTNGLKT